MTVKTILAVALTAGLTAGCAPRDVILSGERVDLRDGMASAPAQPANEVRAVSIEAAQVNADWTHRNGSVTHQIRHPALGSALAQVFAAPIGEGENRRARITADPIVAGGVIYAMDSASRVTATATNGAPVWSRDLTPVATESGSASGGGLAYGAGKVFATTGFGVVSALDPATGGVIWTQNLNASGGSAPAVSGDLVYVVGRDSRVWALEASTGRIKWTLDGTPTLTSFSGGSGAAVTRDMAVFPLPSGELQAAFPEGGLRRWSSIVAGQRLGSAAAAAVNDISGDPVIDGGRVYAGNASGRVVALDLATGDRIWTATEGAAGPIWVAGGSVFFVNDLNELIRVDAADGAVVWRVGLPGFVENRAKRQKTRFVHYGPVLAGGRLVLASSDGVMRQFDPTSGALVGQVGIPGGAASNPVVAGSTLYVVNTKGQLLAFR